MVRMCLVLRTIGSDLQFCSTWIQYISFEQTVYLLRYTVHAHAGFIECGSSNDLTEYSSRFRASRPGTTYTYSSKGQVSGNERYCECTLYGKMRLISDTQLGPGLGHLIPAPYATRHLAFLPTLLLVLISLSSTLTLIAEDRPANVVSMCAV